MGHGKNWTHADDADEPKPKKVDFLKDIKINKFISGGIHSAVLTEDGKILTFGCGSGNFFLFFKEIIILFYIKIF